MSMEKQEKKIKKSAAAERSGEKKLYIAENGESAILPIVSGEEKLVQLCSQTGTLPDQDEESIGVMVKAPALRLNSLFGALEIEKGTKIRIPGPFSNLPSILSGRSLIPLPLPPHPSSTDRTITSGPPTSSSSSSNNSALSRLPSNAVPALFLRIGSWQSRPNNEGDLLFKFDFRTNKLAWEIVWEGPSNHRIETDWSNIIAIQADIEDHKQGIIQLELQNPPRFYKGIESRRLKHLKWVAESDFTEGCSVSLNRRHFAMFAPGVLGGNYKRLLKKNKHLLEVSQKSFPTSQSPHFSQDST